MLEIQTITRFDFRIAPCISSTSTSSEPSSPSPTRARSRAPADIVHKTQSAVSMQMKRLEERVARTLFERDGRATKLSEDGERLLDYARRIVRLQGECIASFNDADLTGRVRLGLPDDYADRYLPEILARFSRSNPRAEVTVVCEPTPEPDRARRLRRSRPCDHHPCRPPRSADIIRVEQLLWVTSARHATHEEQRLPLALGRPTCNWRLSALEALEHADASSASCSSAGTRPRRGGRDGGARGLGAAGERHPLRDAGARAVRRLPGPALVQDRAGAKLRRDEPARRRARRPDQAEPRQSRRGAAR
jgi:DNA-binding transcriptional LysR family regulator